jgi:hypothetical protein
VIENRALNKILECKSEQLQNVVVEWLTLLLRIQEVPGSSNGPEGGYPELFRGVSQSFHANAGITP